MFNNVTHLKKKGKGSTKRLKSYFGAGWVKRVAYMSGFITHWCMVVTCFKY